MMRRIVAAHLLSLALVAPGPARAQGVSLAGVMGGKALLVIDGQTQMLAVGESARGVKLVQVSGDEARIEHKGSVSSLRVGAAPVTVGGAARSSSGQIVLSAGPGGHFISGGTINGRSVNFMVDTGATLVAIGAADAQRLGLDLSSARPAMMGTANGNVVAQLITLNSVRLGEVEVFNVNAVVTPMAMPYVLLGNSFLARFQMRRENDVMRLEARR
jgi:aspartyl protease family protein